jgi:tetrahydromethanopterin S-methyltransferase subunit B
MNYKSIKVSDEEYQMIQKARTELANRGLRSLDGHPQVKNNAPSDLTNFALGAIVGLGAAALLALLVGGDDQ